MRAWNITAVAAGRGVKTSEDALPIMVWRIIEATRKIMTDGWKWETRDGRGKMYEENITNKIFMILHKSLLIFVH